MLPKKEVFSFRAYLQLDLLPCVSHFEDAVAAANTLTEFVVVLSMYREEGTDLFPVIFIGEDLNKVLTTTNGIDAISIGRGTQNKETIHKSFKQCAQLADGREWAIYVVLEQGTIHYGIFRTNPSPVEPTAFERLRQNTSSKENIIGITRLGRSFIEVRNARGLYRFVNMAGDHAETASPKDTIKDFTKMATRDVPPQFKGQMESFYNRLGLDVLHSHFGTLMAVIPAQKPIPNFFFDGIQLSRRLDILSILQQADQDNYHALHKLIAWNQLIRRMACMDGITILDSCGSVVGYSYFIQSSQAGSKTMANAGGARRRAFDALVSRLGENLLAIFYKSQDGVVEMGIKQER